MTALLEAIQTVINEGIKLTTIFALVLLWRKHSANKRMRNDIEAIKKAVGVVECVEKNDLFKSTENSLLRLSQAVGLSALPVNVHMHQVSTTYLKKGKSKMKKFTSRKFLMAVVAGFLIIANDGLDLNLDNTTITAFCSIVVGYIVGEAATDVAKVRASKNDVIPGDTGPAE